MRRYFMTPDLFHYLKDLMTEETKSLPKRSLQNINQHLDGDKRIEKFDERGVCRDPD